MSGSRICQEWDLIADLWILIDELLVSYRLYGWLIRAGYDDAMEDLRFCYLLNTDGVLRIYPRFEHCYQDYRL